MEAGKELNGADEAAHSNAALHSLYGKCSLFVRNLSFEMTSQELEGFFESVGPMRKCFVVSDKETGKCKGYGFVIFALEDHAKQALEELNGKRFHDRRLILERALRRQNSMEQEDRIAIIQEKEKLLKKNTEKKEEKSVAPVKQVPSEKRDRAYTTDVTDTKDASRKPVHKKFKIDDDEPDAASAPSLSKSPSPAPVKQPAKRPKTPEKKLETFVKISNLPKDVTKKQIYKKVKKYDGIDVEYPIEGEPHTAKIRFGTIEKAESAKDKLDKHIFKGSELSAFVIAPNMKQWRLIVRNIPFQYYEKHVKDFFSGFGKIMECKVPLSEKGKPRGFAFIQFSSQKEAQKAIDEKNGSKLGGREIAVDFALSQADYFVNKESIERLPEGAEIKESNDVDAPVKGKEKDEEGDVHSEEADDTPIEENHEDDQIDSYIKEDHSESMLQDKKRKEEQMKRTVFIRNLGFDVSKDELTERLQEFGKVEYCYIVLDQLTERSRGTAFACFKNQSDADELVRRGNAPPESDSFSKSSLLSGIVTEGLSIRGRPFFVCPAVDRGTAQKLTDIQKKKKDIDKRNLYLAKEGEIEPNTPAANTLYPDELNLRMKMKDQKYRKLKNINFFVSKTRLSVHNLPKKMEKKQLRDLFREAATGSVLKDSPIIKQAIIMKPKDEASGAKSLGYGFVDFSKHEHALQALRKLNNNPNILPHGRRLIVEFAVEDSRKIAKFKISTMYGKNATGNAVAQNANTSAQATSSSSSSSPSTTTAAAAASKKRKSQQSENQTPATPAKKAKKTRPQKPAAKSPAKTHTKTKTPAKPQHQKAAQAEGDLGRAVAGVGEAKAKARKFKKPRGIKLDQEDRHLDALVHKHRSKMLGQRK